MKKQILFLSLFLSGLSAFALPKLLERQSFNVYEIKNLNIDLSWENIDVQKCDEDDNILVEIFCNNKKYAPSLNATDNTIYVKTNKQNNAPLQNKKCTVIIHLPASVEFDQVKLSTTSGEIHTQMHIITNKLYCSSTSGDQSITVEAFADEASFKATSGEIYVEAVYGQTLIAQATSGSVFVREFESQANFTASTASISTTSGSIKLTQAKVSKAKLKSTSGSITLEGLVSQAFDISSTSGSIGMELEAAPSDNSRISATSGSIFMGVPGDADFGLWVETTSGSFTNALIRQRIGSHVDYQGQINKGGATIKINTTSGNVSIDSNNGSSANISNKKSSSDSDSELPVVSFDDPIF